MKRRAIAAATAALTITSLGLAVPAAAAVPATAAAPAKKVRCPHYVDKHVVVALDRIRVILPDPSDNFWEAGGHLSGELTCGVVGGGLVVLTLQKKTGEKDGKAVWQHEDEDSGFLEGHKAGTKFRFEVQARCDSYVQWRLKMYFGTATLADHTSVPAATYYWPGPHEDSPGKRLDCRGRP